MVRPKPSCLSGASLFPSLWSLCWPATPWGHTHDTLHPASHWPFLTSLWACVRKEVISINCISCWSPLSLCHWLCWSNTFESGFEGAASNVCTGILEMTPLGVKSCGPLPSSPVMMWLLCHWGKLSRFSSECLWAKFTFSPCQMQPASFFWPHQLGDALA